MDEGLLTLGIHMIARVPSFKPSKGLRQGDPLSPFLFMLVVDGLGILMNRMKEMGLTESFVIGGIECQCIIYNLQIIPYSFFYYRGIYSKPFAFQC